MEHLDTQRCLYARYKKLLTTTVNKSGFLIEILLRIKIVTQERGMTQEILRIRLIDEGGEPKAQAPACSQQAVENPLGDLPKQSVDCSLSGVDWPANGDKSGRFRSE
uniref:Uncharacterized protein n=1 Tax=Romanomermis culicivorax TaxID=13658 RepID=A0A915KWI8_ROMCU